jgi:hypothetical protein
MQAPQRTAFGFSRIAQQKTNPYLAKGSPVLSDDWNFQTISFSTLVVAFRILSHFLSQIVPGLLGYSGFAGCSG